MLTKIEITAAQLRSGDAIQDAEGNLRTVVEVERRGNAICGLDTKGFSFTFLSSARVTVSLDIVAGRLYLWGNRDADAEQRVVQVTGEESVEDFFESVIAGDERPTLLWKTFFICEATDKEISALYLKCRGTRCPYCRSTDIVGGDHNTDDNWHSVLIECGNCGATWDDIYTLNSISDAKAPWTNE